MNPLFRQLLSGSPHFEGPQPLGGLNPTSPAARLRAHYDRLFSAAPSGPVLADPTQDFRHLDAAGKAQWLGNLGLGLASGAGFGGSATPREQIGLPGARTPLLNRPATFDTQSLQGQLIGALQSLLGGGTANRGNSQPSLPPSTPNYPLPAPSIPDSPQPRPTAALPQPPGLHIERERLRRVLLDALTTGNSPYLYHMHHPSHTEGIVQHGLRDGGTIAGRPIMEHGYGTAISMFPTADLPVWQQAGHPFEPNGDRPEGAAPSYPKPAATFDLSELRRDRPRDIAWGNMAYQEWGMPDPPMPEDEYRAGKQERLDRRARVLGPYLRQAPTPAAPPDFQMGAAGRTEPLSPSSTRQPSSSPLQHFLDNTANPPNYSSLRLPNFASHSAPIGGLTDREQALRWLDYQGAVDRHPGFEAAIRHSQPPASWRPSPFWDRSFSVAPRPEPPAPAPKPTYPSNPPETSRDSYGPLVPPRWWDKQNKPFFPELPEGSGFASADAAKAIANRRLRTKLSFLAEPLGQINPQQPAFLPGPRPADWVPANPAQFHVPRFEQPKVMTDRASSGKVGSGPQDDFFNPYDPSGDGTPGFRMSLGLPGGLERPYSELPREVQPIILSHEWGPRRNLGPRAPGLQSITEDWTPPGSDTPLTPDQQRLYMSNRRGAQTEQLIRDFLASDGFRGMLPEHQAAIERQLSMVTNGKRSLLLGLQPEDKFSTDEHIEFPTNSDRDRPVYDSRQTDAAKYHDNPRPRGWDYLGLPDEAFATYTTKDGRQAETPSSSADTHAQENRKYISVKKRDGSSFRLPGYKLPFATTTDGRPAITKLDGSRITDAKDLPSPTGPGTTVNLDQPLAPEHFAKLLAATSGGTLRGTDGPDRPATQILRSLFNNKRKLNEVLKRNHVRVGPELEEIRNALAAGQLPSSAPARVILDLMNAAAPDFGNRAFQSFGYQSGYGWGERVSLPPGFNPDAGPDGYRGPYKNQPRPRPYHRDWSPSAPPAPSIRDSKRPASEDDIRPKGARGVRGGGERRPSWAPPSLDKSWTPNSQWRKTERSPEISARYRAFVQEARRIGALSTEDARGELATTPEYQALLGKKLLHHTQFTALPGIQESGIVADITRNPTSYSTYDMLKGNALHNARASFFFPEGEEDRGRLPTSLQYQPLARLSVPADEALPHFDPWAAKRLLLHHAAGQYKYPIRNGLSQLITTRASGGIDPRAGGTPWAEIALTGTIPPELVHSEDLGRPLMGVPTSDILDLYRRKAAEHAPQRTAMQWNYQTNRYQLYRDPVPFIDPNGEWLPDAPPEPVLDPVEHLARLKAALRK